MAKSKQNQTKPFTYDAFGFKQRNAHGPQLVVFVAPVNEILKFSSVDELSPSKPGPQREKKDARVQAIAKFLADKSNTIPTAVILAFRSQRARFKSNTQSNSGVLEISSSEPKAATVVDGQHRLYGIDAAIPTMEVAVVALLDADEVEQAFQFLVINNKASKVPATHTKALLAKMKDTPLADRLKSARLAFDVEGVKDVDLVNSDPESPFRNSINWTTTPKPNRIVQATAIEASLEYLGGLGVPEYADRDTRRSVFLAIWKTIKAEWKSFWKKDSRLISKVGIVCMTRFVIDLITTWADNDELNIEIANLGDIEDQTRKILKFMNPRFWETPWAEKAPGGFDTNQGRDRIVDAIQQLYRNGRKENPWYTDIEVIDQVQASSD
jgi:DGQHR domain-containing protein